MKPSLSLFKKACVLLSVVLITFFVNPAISAGKGEKGGKGDKGGGGRGGAGSKGGKGGKDGGGGIFSVATFWDIVEREMVPTLRNLESEQKKLLSNEQIAKLLSYMKPTVTRIEIKTDQIYVYEAGKKVAVDAANYPSQRLIELYKLAWQLQSDSNYDVKHLILHEFMGLAMISDKAHISSKIFQPQKLPISFAAEKLSCDTSVKYIRVKDNSWYVRDMPDLRKTAVTLSQPTRLNAAAKCVETDKQTGGCLKFANDYRIKTAQVRIPVDFDENDSSGSTYFVDASINLTSSYFGYGWGAAAGTLFKRNAQLQVIWKLIQIDASHKERVVTILTQDSQETDDYSTRVTLYNNIPVPEFVETLTSNGHNLSIMPYNGEVSSFFHSYNVVGFLEGTAANAGHQDRADKDNYILNNILKGMKGNSLPFRIFVECTLFADET